MPSSNVLHVVQRPVGIGCVFTELAWSRVSGIVKICRSR